MPKTLLILMSLCCAPVYATFGSATAWDIQTTGSDNNGGAFDSGVGSPGTNESMGSGTSVSITLATGTTGTSSPAITSTTHGPGNFVTITGGAGCTTGTFEILSQAAGVGTFDHSMGSPTDVCTGTLGGSNLTIANVYNLAVSSNTVWIKAGTYSLTTFVTLPILNNVITEGYQTTHGDFGTRPLVTTSTNSTPLFNVPGGVRGPSILNINFSNTAGTSAIGFGLGPSGPTGPILFYLCKFTGFTEAIVGNYQGPYYYADLLSLIGVEVASSNADPFGAVWNDGPTYMNGCYIHDTTG